MKLRHNRECNKDLDKIGECLDGEHSLQNVFVSTNQQHRFLYFDQDSDDKNNNEEKTQTRRKMKWKEINN